MGLKQTSSCLGYQQITDLDPAVGLTVPTGATYCVIVAQTAEVRWRDDGGVPTGSVGMPLAAGVTLLYDGALKAIQFFSATGAINVSYYQ